MCYSSALKSSSTVPMPAMPNLLTSRLTGKRRRVRPRVRRQPPHRASPSRRDVRRDGGELYDVRGGGEARDDDVAWARDVSALEDASPFDALGQV